MKRGSEHKSDWLKGLGMAISDRRKFVAISQQQLADRVGIHRTYVSDIELGKRNLSVNMLNQVAVSLETASAKLLSQADAYEIKQCQES